MDQNVDKAQLDASTDAKPWVTPEVSVMRAGDAENSNKAAFEGGGFS